MYTSDTNGLPLSHYSEPGIVRKDRRLCWADEMLCVMPALSQSVFLRVSPGFLKMVPHHNVLAFAVAVDSFQIRRG